MKCKCNRGDCFAYDIKKDNNCKALVQTYEDNNKCPFYKERKEKRGIKLK